MSPRFSVIFDSVDALALVISPKLALSARAVSHEKSPLPSDVAAWLDKEASANVDDIPGEWSDDEVYLSLPRPGGDAWLRISLPDGQAEYERTDRGWISYFNDLHKGRNTGEAWAWFIDIFAIACVIFIGVLFVYMQFRNKHVQEKKANK